MPIDLGNATWTLDIALESADGAIVLAECKNVQDAIEQGQLAEFAYKVERLRGKTGASVAGIFFAKRAYRIGAVKVGTGEGIQVIVCAADQTLTQLTITYHSYDPDREMRLRVIAAHLTDSLTVQDSVVLRQIRTDGTIIKEIRA